MRGTQKEFLLADRHDKHGEQTVQFALLQAGLSVLDVDGVARILLVGGVVQVNENVVLSVNAPIGEMEFRQAEMLVLAYALFGLVA